LESILILKKDLTIRLEFLKNILIKIEYEGTRYNGWQIQPNVPTVQKVINKVLRIICQFPVSVSGCSRTDSGVHASCQIANIFIPDTIPLARLIVSANSLLPDDIAITDIAEVSGDYRIKHTNSGKRYLYQIFNSRIKPLKDRQYQLWVKKPLDYDEMENACQYFIGTHDFSAFRGRRCQQSSPVKTIHDFRISRKQSPQTSIITITVEGSGFLKNMVRIMVGTLIDIGRGRAKEGIIKKALQSGIRIDAGATAPAMGLCLDKIFVSPDPFENRDSLIKSP